MIKTRESIKEDQESFFGDVFPIGVDAHIPVEPAEIEKRRFQFRMLTRPPGRWLVGVDISGIRHAHLHFVERPYVPNGQLNLELSVPVRKVPGVEVLDGDVATIPLGGRIKTKLDLLPVKSLIGTEMFPIEEGKGKVHIDAHPFRRIPPNQVHAQDFLCSGERDSPFLVAVDKFLGSDIPMEVTGYGLGHHKSEDVCIPTVREFCKTVQKGHAHVHILQREEDRLS